MKFMKRGMACLLLLGLLFGSLSVQAASSGTIRLTAHVDEYRVTENVDVNLRLSLESGDFSALNIMDNELTKADANGDVTFRPITVTKPGTYKFQIVQETVVGGSVIRCNNPSCYAINSMDDYAAHGMAHMDLGEASNYSIITDPFYFIDPTVWTATCEVASDFSVKVSYRNENGQGASVPTFSMVHSWPLQKSVEDRAAVQSILNNMSLEEVVAQCFLLPADAKGTVGNAGGYLVSDTMLAGGTVTAAKRQADALQASMEVPAFLAAQEYGGNKSPVASKIRDEVFAAPSTLTSFNQAKTVATNKSKFLKSAGINLDLGVSGDISGSGAYAPYSYKDNANTFTPAAVENSQIAVAIGHFPGYGAYADTSAGAVTNNSNSRSDLIPFYAGLDAKADALLISNQVYTNYVGIKPATLTADVYNLARKTMRFEGLLITDNLSDAALSGYTAAARDAFLAGADMVWTNDPGEVAKVVRSVQNGTISESAMREKALRILMTKYRRGILTKYTAPSGEATFQNDSFTDTGTFAEMWEIAQTVGRGTIVLNSNVNMSEAITDFRNSVAIDLNGHNLTAPSFTVPEGKSLTITGAVPVESAGGSAGVSGTKLGIKDPVSGTVTTYEYAKVPKVDAKILTSGGTVTLNGGQFLKSMSVTAGELNVNGACIRNNISVTGGSFVHRNGILDNLTLTNSGSVRICGGTVTDVNATNSGTMNLSESSLIANSTFTNTGDMSIFGTAKVQTVRQESGSLTIKNRIQARIDLAEGQILTPESFTGTVTVKTVDADDVLVSAPTTTGTIQPVNGAYTVLSLSDGVHFAKKTEGTIPVTVTIDGKTKTLGQVPVSSLATTHTIQASDLDGMFSEYGGRPNRILIGSTVANLLNGVYQFTADNLDGKTAAYPNALHTITINDGVRETVRYATRGSQVTVTLPDAAEGYHWTVESPYVIANLLKPYRIEAEKDPVIITSNLTVTSQGNVSPYTFEVTLGTEKQQVTLADGESRTFEDLVTGTAYEVKLLGTGDDRATTTILNGSATVGAAKGTIGETDVSYTFQTTLLSETLPETGAYDRIVIFGCGGFLALCGVVLLVSRRRGRLQ